MIEIPLTRGLFAKIDDDDLPLVLGRAWSAHDGQRTTYARAALARKSGKSPRVYMHRVIIGAAPGVEVDHINGDGLDNRRANLRIATRSQNLGNMSKPSTGKSSQYKGVTWLPNRKKWAARIRNNGRTRHLGVFLSELDAARAYDLAAKERFGEFARLNFEVKR